MTAGHNQRALDRAREVIEVRQDDERARAQLQKEIEVSHKRTRYGLAQRPPSIKDTDKALDSWHEQIGSALDTARSAALREQALSATTATDRTRFPVIQEG